MADGPAGAVLDPGRRGLAAALVEQFSVRPNAADRESPYIERNIAATRQAYGIGPTTGSNTGTTRGGHQVAAGRSRRRHHDRQRPAAGPERAVAHLHPAAAAEELLRLSRRRWTSTATTSTASCSDYIVAARELSPNSLSGNQTDWINRHTVYTHGNGFVAAPANRVNAAVRECRAEAANSNSGYPDLHGQRHRLAGSRATRSSRSTSRASTTAR